MAVGGGRCRFGIKYRQSDRFRFFVLFVVDEHDVFDDHLVGDLLGVGGVDHHQLQLECGGADDIGSDAGCGLYFESGDGRPGGPGAVPAGCVDDACSFGSCVAYDTDLLGNGGDRGRACTGQLHGRRGDVLCSFRRNVPQRGLGGRMT